MSNTKRQNFMQRSTAGGPSKYRGVIWHKSNGKWEARIYEAGKQRFLGYFTSELAAAEAYDSRAVDLHGSNAKVNFPLNHPLTRNNLPASKLVARKQPVKAVPEAKPKANLRRKRAAWEGSETEEESSCEESLDQSGSSGKQANGPVPERPPSQTNLSDLSSDADSTSTCLPFTADRLESEAIQALAGLRQMSSRQASAETPTDFSLIPKMTHFTKPENPKPEVPPLPKKMRPSSGSSIWMPLPRRPSSEDVLNLYELTKASAPPVHKETAHGPGPAFRKMTALGVGHHEKRSIPWNKISKRWSSDVLPSEEKAKASVHPSIDFRATSFKPAEPEVILKGRHMPFLHAEPKQETPFAVQPNTFHGPNVQDFKLTMRQPLQEVRLYHQRENGGMKAGSVHGSPTNHHPSTSFGLHEVPVLQADAFRTAYQNPNRLSTRPCGLVRARTLPLRSFSVGKDLTAAASLGSQLSDVDKKRLLSAPNCMKPKMERTLSHSIEPTGKVLKRIDCMEGSNLRTLYSGLLPKGQKAF